MLEQVSILTDTQPKIAIVDKGYRSVEIDGVRILRCGQRRGLTPTLHAGESSGAARSSRASDT